MYCRTHNVRVCLYITYIACGSASLCIKTLFFFLTVLALSAAGTVADRKIRYDAKTPLFAIFGTRVIYVFDDKHLIRALNCTGLTDDFKSSLASFSDTLPAFRKKYPQHSDLYASVVWGTSGTTVGMSSIVDKSINQHFHFVD